MLVNTIALQEAKAPTAIENIFITEDALYSAVSETVQQDKAPIATKEVLPYREAFSAGYQLIKEDNHIDLEGIIGMFRQIRNSSAGLRSTASSTVIQRGQSEFRSGEVIYTPPMGAGVFSLVTL